MGRLVAHYGAAFVTAVDDDISALGVRLRFDRAKNSAAFVRSVTGVNIDMKRAKAEGAMVARRIAERKHLLAAILADEA